MTTSVSVFGLGYVGCVSSACFASEGNRVIGVDVSQAKVDQINEGRSTIVEEGIADLVADVVKAGRLSATTVVREAVLGSGISLVCVGTPSRPNGSISAIAQGVLSGACFDRGRLAIDLQSATDHR